MGSDIEPIKARYATDENGNNGYVQISHLLFLIQLQSAR